MFGVTAALAIQCTSNCPVTEDPVDLNIYQFEFDCDKILARSGN